MAAASLSAPDRGALAGRRDEADAHFDLGSPSTRPGTSWPTGRRWVPPPGAAGRLVPNAARWVLAFTIASRVALRTLGRPWSLPGLCGSQGPSRQRSPRDASHGASTLLTVRWTIEPASSSKQRIPASSVSGAPAPSGCSVTTSNSREGGAQRRRCHNDAHPTTWLSQRRRCHRTQATLQHHPPHRRRDRPATRRRDRVWVRVCEVTARRQVIAGRGEPGQGVGQGSPRARRVRPERKIEP